MVKTEVEVDVMEGAIDIRLIVTLGGILFSVAGAAAIARHQIKSLIEKLGDVESRLRSLDKATDSQEVSIQNHAQRLEVMSGMLAPKERETRARETATMLVSIKRLEKDVEGLKDMHNGSHPNIEGPT